MSSKDFDVLIKKAVAAGWVLKKGSRHYRLTSPTGAILFLAASPSDWRAVHNMRAMLRRHGAGV